MKPYTVKPYPVYLHLIHTQEALFLHIRVANTLYSAGGLTKNSSLGPAMARASTEPQQEIVTTEPPHQRFSPDVVIHITGRRILRLMRDKGTYSQPDNIVACVSEGEENITTLRGVFKYIIATVAALSTTTHTQGTGQHLALRLRENER